MIPSCDRDRITADYLPAYPSFVLKKAKNLGNFIAPIVGHRRNSDNRMKEIRGHFLQTTGFIPWQKCKSAITIKLRNV